MIAKASAPAKTILFGEHSVVYDEPAIAGAVNKRAYVTIKPSEDDITIFRAPDIGFEAELLTNYKKYVLLKGKPGIIRYILEALYRVHDHTPIDITLNSNVPIGSGLGSSAAVTVATLAALYRYHNIRFNKHSLAHDAYMVEQAVQGVASPLDTLVSTYGGLRLSGRAHPVLPPARQGVAHRRHPRDPERQDRLGRQSFWLGYGKVPANVS